MKSCRAWKQKHGIRSKAAVASAYLCEDSNDGSVVDHALAALGESAGRNSAQDNIRVVSSGNRDPAVSAESIMQCKSLQQVTRHPMPRLMAPFYRTWMHKCSIESL